MSNIRKKTKENAEIINHLHEIYSNICKELKATINKQGMKRNIRMRTFKLWSLEGEIAPGKDFKNVYFTEWTVRTKESI